jgi:hypothetical protein
MYYPYNALFGRGSLNAFEAIISYSYLYMKMPAINGVITVHGDQTEARNIEKKIYISLSREYLQNRFYNRLHRVPPLEPHASSWFALR